MKYIVTINERTAKGKALSAFLKADGVEMKPLKSLNELNDELLAEKKAKSSKLGATPRKKKLSKAEKDFIEGMKEVKEMLEGKRKLKTIDELLNEK